MPRQSSFASALRTALKGVTVQPADGAAVRLAYGYAQLIDADPETLTKVGPELLRTLTALGMTPAGRAAVVGKGVGNADTTPASPLDELRERRRARQRDATAVDTATR